MDEVEETYMVMTALDNLTRVHSIWAKNYLSYSAMTPTARIWWWRAAKKQAEAGVPAMATLLTEVVKLRMLK
jgi:hypothetical protein